MKPKSTTKFYRLPPFIIDIHILNDIQNILRQSFETVKYDVEKVYIDDVNELIDLKNVRTINYFNCVANSPVDIDSERRFSLEIEMSTEYAYISISDKNNNVLIGIANQIKEIIESNKRPIISIRKKTTRPVTIFLMYLLTIIFISGVIYIISSRQNIMFSVNTYLLIGVLCFIVLIIGFYAFPYKYSIIYLKGTVDDYKLHKLSRVEWKNHLVGFIIGIITGLITGVIIGLLLG